MTIGGESVFSRNLAEVSLAKAATTFMVDWHLVALPVVQVRGTDNPIALLKDWLSKMIIISPDPSTMDGVSDENSLEPAYNCSNFASWFGGLLGEYPASYTVVEKYLKEVLPDFQDFQNKPISDVAKRLFVRFAGGNGQSLKLDSKNLSDGEKCFFVCSVVLGANKFYGPVFCLWDEPDNYLSLSTEARGHSPLSEGRRQERAVSPVASSMVMLFDPSAPLPTALLAASSDVLDEKESYDLAYYNVRNMLSGSPGVIAPAVFGGKLRRIYIYLDPQKLENYGLSLMDVQQAIITWTSQH